MNQGKSVQDRAWFGWLKCQKDPEDDDMDLYLLSARGEVDTVVERFSLEACFPTHRLSVRVSVILRLYDYVATI